LGEPLTTALTLFTLGFQTLLERLCEWDTLIPKDTPLPQKSHLAIFRTSFFNNGQHTNRFDNKNQEKFLFSLK
jgi:hypothetical protein